MIFVWPWNKNAQTKQKHQRNRNRGILLVYQTDTNVRGIWLLKWTLGWKTFMPENFPEIKIMILCFDVILQHDWPIEQCLLHIRVFFGGKTKRPCFDFSIHWLIKQITNTSRLCSKKYWREPSTDWTCEIHCAQHMISMKKLRFSSRSRTKVDATGHWALLEHSLALVETNFQGHTKIVLLAVLFSKWALSEFPHQTKLSVNVPAELHYTQLL